MPDRILELRNLVAKVDTRRCNIRLSSEMKMVVIGERLCFEVTSSAEYVHSTFAALLPKIYYPDTSVCVRKSF